MLTKLLINRCETNDIFANMIVGVDEVTDVPGASA